MTITPKSSTIVAGNRQGYVVSGYDTYGNSRGRVAAALSVDGGGSCSATSCTSTSAGVHTVTATFGGRSVTATLRVIPAAAARLTITPKSSTIVSGGSQTYAVSGFDRYGNSLGRIAATLSISGDGSCSASSCTASVPALYTVTATSGSLTVTASLRVTRPAGRTSRAGW